MNKFGDNKVFDCYKKTRDFFNDWSPIGYVPEDEYDDLSMQICGLINKKASGTEVIDFVFNYLVNRVGLNDIGRREVEKHMEGLFEFLYAG
jgi:hypothetical protein